MRCEKCVENAGSWTKAPTGGGILLGCEDHAGRKRTFQGEGPLMQEAETQKELNVGEQ